MEIFDRENPGLEFDRQDMELAQLPCCDLCQETLGDVYYEIADRRVCPQCLEGFKRWTV